ncbi:MAG: redoxin domain-containing protein [Phycisphaerales bacterium]|nr:redoxin domain-containing protein [Phycisphaerales bacterium]
MTAMGFISLAPCVSSARAEDAKPTSHLLFVLADKEDEGYDDLAKCERLTVEKYRELGTTVTEVSPDDLRAWLKIEGKPFVKAHRNMQLFWLARAKGAQAYGGLASMTVGNEMAVGFGAKEGIYFHPWGVTLTGCDNRSSIDLSGGSAVRAIPLKLGGDQDPWGLTRRIESRVATSALPEGGFNPLKDRPFLGVRTEGNTLVSVIDGSPAVLAGIAIGDKLIRVNGKEIANVGDIAGALVNEKPGNEIDVTYEHEGKQTTKRVALADYHELVTVKQSPIGKPLADLRGVDVQGREVSLDQFKDKLVMVDFWTTWCEPCKDEMPVLQATWEKYKDDGVEWLGVSADTDDVDRLWKTMVERNGLGGVQLRSPQWAETMHVNSYPTVLVVDRHGVVRANVRGGQLAETLEALMAEGTPTSDAPSAGDSR